MTYIVEIIGEDNTKRVIGNVQEVSFRDHESKGVGVASVRAWIGIERRKIGYRPGADYTTTEDVERTATKDFEVAVKAIVRSNQGEFISEWTPTGGEPKFRVNWIPGEKHVDTGARGWDYLKEHLKSELQSEALEPLGVKPGDVRRKLLSIRSQVEYLASRSDMLSEGHNGAWRTLESRWVALQTARGGRTYDPARHVYCERGWFERLHSALDKIAKGRLCEVKVSEWKRSVSELLDGKYS